MSAPPFEASWLGHSSTPTEPQPNASTEFVRLWVGFMATRVALSAVILLLQASLYLSSIHQSVTLVGVSVVYFFSTLAARLLNRPHTLGGSFNRAWLTMVGIDVVALTVFQVIHGGGSINYTPLYALPILLASILGSLRLALGTAATITMVMLGISAWEFLRSTTDSAPYFVQSALSGAGFFAVALLSSQLSSRLAIEGQRARQSQTATRIQRQVNALVIESLPDGILVVDGQGAIRAANPAAQALLAVGRAPQGALRHLNEQPAWEALLHLTRLCIGTGQARVVELSIRQDDLGERRIKVRTSLAATQEMGTDSLCVVFMQDLRELEARLRTEKLASMGRMSTAVAHEIRNPLAAISQANALLEEDLSDPRLRRLTAMISQNARRLDKIVDDVLNAARVQTPQVTVGVQSIGLREQALRICSDWSQQNAVKTQIDVVLPDNEIQVRFEGDHLRRVLVNLLDNALRHAAQTDGAILVHVSLASSDRTNLTVWSDGPPLESGVERHLFEPFFSSHSRSSGLGLFICRELCEGHGAHIHYLRCERPGGRQPTAGNAFVISLQMSPTSQTMEPWQPLLQ